MAERTVSRLLPKRHAPPSQTWRTFLANQPPELGKAVPIREVGGLHHRYVRRAA